MRPGDEWRVLTWGDWAIMISAIAIEIALILTFGV